MKSKVHSQRGPTRSGLPLTWPLSSSHSGLSFRPARKFCLPGNSPWNAFPGFSHHPGLSSGVPSSEVTGLSIVPPCCSDCTATPQCLLLDSASVWGGKQPSPLTEHCLAVYCESQNLTQEEDPLCLPLDEPRGQLWTLNVSPDGYYDLVPKDVLRIPFEVGWLRPPRPTFPSPLRVPRPHLSRPLGGSWKGTWVVAQAGEQACDLGFMRVRMLLCVFTSASRSRQERLVSGLHPAE